MIPVRYIWLTWAVLLFCVWAVLFSALRRYRTLMWWSSILALPFGCSEPFFLMSYWHPPSLLNLTATVHADLETFLFCYSIGGTAAVSYHVVTGRPMVDAPLQSGRALLDHCAALLAPLPVFITVIVLTQEIIWAGIAGFVAGTVARLAVRHDLAAKTLIGGLLFFAYYSAVLLALLWLVPGYFDVAWNAAGPAAVRIGRLPVTELLFGLTFGLYWSGLFEQIACVIPLPPPIRRQRTATK